MRLTPLVLGLATALLATGPAAGGDDLEKRVRDMVQAAREMDYQGVLIHGMPVGVESMRFYHAGNADGSYRERLVMLTGPERELVRDNDSVRRYHPDSGQVVIGPRRSGTGIFRLDAGDLDRVRSHYIIQRGPSGRIAGREARAIEFRAADGERFTYRIWHDRATNLPLQTEILDAQGQVQETFMFATVETGVRPSTADLELDAPSGLAQVRRQRLASEDRPAVLRSLALPPGFRLQAGFQGPGEKDSRHYFYSDGLATLSVFLDRSEDMASGGGEAREILQRGALHACSVSRGGYRVTVLGELPGKVMRRIAYSLQPSEEEEAP